MENEDIIRALKDGNVPPEGTFEISVGRDSEILEFHNILENIKQGKASAKFVEGKFGTGKSFLLKMIEENALENNFVVSKITITRDVPFNKFEEVYKKIVSTLKCKTGVSLQHIIERWINELKIAAMDETEDPLQQNHIVLDNIHMDLQNARNYSNSFVTAIESYYEASVNGDDEIANYAQAWLRCDDNIPFTVKRQFGVKGGVSKENVFDFLKALSALISSMGYNGLVILIDEIEFIIMLANKNIRSTALDYVRYLYDECNMGNFEKTLFVMAGTDEFFENPEKGVPSYPALHQRIKDAIESEYKDLRKPIMKLEGFTNEDLDTLTRKILVLYSSVYGNEITEKFDDSLIVSIIDFYKEKSILTGSVQPRDYVRGVVSALDIVQQNPDKFDSGEKIIDLFDNLEWDNFDDELEMFE
ncbi:MAG: BREX system ATP-binding domain-containing protein [Methanobacteriaceae archaeon]|nr:BREX system ATP-binding domain-containing protein [Methanobacteriaceae archaeon]